MTEKIWVELVAGFASGGETSVKTSASTAQDGLQEASSEGIFSPERVCPEKACLQAGAPRRPYPSRPSCERASAMGSCVGGPGDAEERHDCDTQELQVWQRMQHHGRLVLLQHDP